jgi:hypothetical protein
MVSDDKYDRGCACVKMLLFILSLACFDVGFGYSALLVFLLGLVERTKVMDMSIL